MNLFCVLVVVAVILVAVWVRIVDWRVKKTQNAIDELKEVVRFEAQVIREMLKK